MTRRRLVLRSSFSPSPPPTRKIREGRPASPPIVPLYTGNDSWDVQRVWVQVQGGVVGLKGGRDGWVEILGGWVREGLLVAVRGVEVR